MKIGRNLPRGRANEENQQELERMRRRDLPNSAPDSSGNPWETIMHKDEHHAPFYRRRYIHFDWGYLIVLLVVAAAVILFAVFASSAQAESAIPPFTEGEPHTSSPEFALYFETMTASQGSATLTIRKSVYDAAQAETLWTTVAEDLQIFLHRIPDRSAFALDLPDLLRRGADLRGSLRHAV